MFEELVFLKKEIASARRERRLHKNQITKEFNNSGNPKRPWRFRYNFEKDHKLKPRITYLTQQISVLVRERNRKDSEYRRCKQRQHS